jgi:hypothetical protein
MVVGLDRFRKHFADFADQYVLIGGTATFLVLDEAGLDARMTRDLDIVLCVEALDSVFVKAFWTFVQAGGYQNRQRSTGKKVFYRFDKPADLSYPARLELFSRNLADLLLKDGSHLTPIPMAEDVSSLSAILLDSDYYEFLHARKRNIEGVPVVGEECLIPLKARAWLDLTARKKAGEHIDSRDIKKHRNDIFRLYQLLRPDLHIEIPESIKADIGQFFTELKQQPEPDLKSIGIRGVQFSEIVQTICNIYGITPPDV